MLTEFWFEFGVAVTKLQDHIFVLHLWQSFSKLKGPEVQFSIAGCTALSSSCSYRYAKEGEISQRCTWKHATSSCRF